jgi:hypothetical protein
MLQRIQTVLLFLAGSTDLLLFVLPVATVAADGGGEIRISAGQNWIFAALVLISAAASLAAIGLFGNRPLQARVAYVGMYAILASAGYAAFLIFSSGPSYALGLGLLIPLLSANLSLFAVRAIRKDEELVRSADRLR